MTASDSRPPESLPAKGGAENPDLTTLINDFQLATVEAYQALSTFAPDENDKVAIRERKRGALEKAFRTRPVSPDSSSQVSPTDIESLLEQYGKACRRNPLPDPYHNAPISQQKENAARSSLLAYVRDLEQKAVQNEDERVLLEKYRGFVSDLEVKTAERGEAIMGMHDDLIAAYADAASLRSQVRDLEARYAILTNALKVSNDDYDNATQKVASLRSRLGEVEARQLTAGEARALSEGWRGDNFKSRRAFDKAFESAFAKLRASLPADTAP